MHAPPGNLGSRPSESASSLPTDGPPATDPAASPVDRALAFYRAALAANARIVEAATEAMNRHRLPLIGTGLLAAAACLCFSFLTTETAVQIADGLRR